MKIINISSQEEFDALPLTSEEEREIHIHDGTVCLRFSYQCPIRCYGASRITLSGTSRYDDWPYLGHSGKDLVAVYDHTVVLCQNGRYIGHLECHDHAFVDSREKETTIKASDYCTILAGQGCYVDAFDHCQIAAIGMANIKAHGNCLLTAFSEANITLYDECRLTAADHCQIKAYGNSKLSISTSSNASLFDQSELTSLSNGFVRAFDNSTVMLPPAEKERCKDFSRIYLHDQSKIQGRQDLNGIEVQYQDYHSSKSISNGPPPTIIHIETQEEFWAVPTNTPYNREIHIHGTAHILVEDYYDCVIHCFDEVFLELCFTNRAVAHDNSRVSAGGHCIVEALDRSGVIACECCHVTARNRSAVEARQEVSVIAQDTSSVSIIRRPPKWPNYCRVYTYDRCTITENECPETTQVFDMRQPAAISESDCT